MVTKDSAPKARIQYTAIDCIWDEHGDAVNVKLKEMFDLNHQIDVSKQEIFQQQTAAAKQFQEERWHDMGAVFLTFSVYTHPDGRLVVDRYDRIADVMGIPAQSFADMHKDKIDELKRHLMDYVKSLQQMTGLVSDAEARDSRALPPEWQVQITEDGYPRVPHPVPLEDLRKGELDEVLRSYLGWHYSVYYHMLLDMVDYQPADFVIKDPKKLTKNRIIELLRHILHRQETVGVQDVFRFQIYINKTGEHSPRYPAKAGAGASYPGLSNPLYPGNSYNPPILPITGSSNLHEGFTQSYLFHPQFYLGYGQGAVIAPPIKRPDNNPDLIGQRQMVIDPTLLQIDQDMHPNLPRIAVANVTAPLNGSVASTANPIMATDTATAMAEDTGNTAEMALGTNMAMATTTATGKDTATLEGTGVADTATARDTATAVHTVMARQVKLATRASKKVSAHEEGECTQVTWQSVKDQQINKGVKKADALTIQESRKYLGTAQCGTSGRNSGRRKPNGKCST
ncbi:hypothetical protein BYT27DRAFT_7213959 [Phlegmacium glaucopus]|nr:hypothetical protein BYT27DRAFT_7213959 [Phlegmacium glaucopus]